MRLSEKQLEVLRLAKDGHNPYAGWGGERNAGIGRGNTIKSLRTAGYLDAQMHLTIEGARALEETTQ